MRRVVLTLIFAIAPAVLGLGFGACGGKTSGAPDGHPPPQDAFGGAERLDAPYFPDASCEVKIESPPLLPGVHVELGSDITTWDSNPPSSGEHYPIWAAFQEYATPVPRGYYVHDLEHGAVVLLYNCDLLGVADAGVSDATVDDAGGADANVDASPLSACDALVAGLRQVVASIPDDPVCDPSIRVRYVLTPDPLIAYPIAAATWGWTYNASCLDLPTLEAFAQDHYAQGPENFCTNGQASF